MECPICSTEGPTLYHENHQERFFRCETCGFIYRDPDSLMTEEEEQGRYLLHDNSLENTGYLRYLNRFLETSVIPNCGMGASILDFGSGPEPVLSHLLRERGYDVTSYDKFFCPDDGYLQRRYDLIILLEVIEHIQEPCKILGRLVPLMKPGSRLVIQTMCADDLSSEEFGKWWYKEDRTHISFFTKDSFSILGNKLDLSLESCEKNVTIFIKKG